LGFSECPDTLQYKGKTEAEPSKVEEAREGKRATGRSTGHHGQAVAATERRTLRFDLLGSSPWAAGF